MKSIVVSNAYPASMPNFRGSSNRTLEVLVNAIAVPASPLLAGQSTTLTVNDGDVVQVAASSYLTDFGCAKDSPLISVDLTSSKAVQTGGFGIQYEVGITSVVWPLQVRIPYLTSLGCSMVEAATSPSIGFFECSDTAITYNVNTFRANNTLAAAADISMTCLQQPSFETPSLNTAVSSTFAVAEVPDTYCLSLTVASKVIPLEDNVSPVITFAQTSASCASTTSWLPPVTPSSKAISIWEIPYSGNDSSNGFFMSYKLFAEVQFTVTPSSIAVSIGLPTGYDTLGFEYETFGSPPPNYLNPTTSFFGNTNGVTLFPGLVFQLPFWVIPSATNPWTFATSASNNTLASNYYMFVRNPNSTKPYGMMLAVILPNGMFVLDMNSPSGSGPQSVAMTPYEALSAPSTMNSEWGMILSTSYVSTDVIIDSIHDGVYMCVRIANTRYVLNAFQTLVSIDDPTPGLDLLTTPGFARTTTTYPTVTLSLITTYTSTYPVNLAWTCWNPTVYGCDIPTDENPQLLPLCTLSASKPLTYPFELQNRCMPSSSSMTTDYVAAADAFLINRCAVIYDEPTLCKTVVGTQQNRCTGFGMRSLGASCESACASVESGILYEPDYNNQTKAPCPNGSVNCGNGLGRCDEIKRMLCATEDAKNLGDCACLNVYESTFPSAVRANQSFSSFQNTLSSMYGLTANLALNPECFWDSCDYDQGIITSATRKHCPKTVTDCVAFLKNINISSNGPTSVQINIQNTCSGTTAPSNSSYCQTIQTLAKGPSYSTSYLINYFFPPPAPSPSSGNADSTGFVLDGGLGTFDYILIALASLINLILLSTAALSLARVMRSKRSTTIKNIKVKPQK